MPYTLYDHLFAIALGIATMGMGAYELWTLRARIDFRVMPLQFVGQGFADLFCLLGGLALVLDGKFPWFSIGGG